MKRLLYISLLLTTQAACINKQEEPVVYDTSIVSSVVKEGLKGKVKTRTMTTSCDSNDSEAWIIDSFDRDGFIVLQRSIGLTKEPHSGKWETSIYEYLPEKHKGHIKKNSIFKWKDSVRYTILSNNSFIEYCYMKEIKRLTSVTRQHLDSLQRYSHDTTLWYDQITGLVTDTSYTSHYYSDTLHLEVSISKTVNKDIKHDTIFIQYHTFDPVGNPTKTTVYNRERKEFRSSFDLCYTYTYYN